MDNCDLQHSRAANPGEGECNFQSYHIIIFNWTLIDNNNEITNHTRYKKVWPIPGIKIN